MTAPAATADTAYELAAFRDGVRAWVDAEVAPFVREWDEAGRFPRELYRRAAQMGLLQLGYPEHLGGTPCAFAFRLAAAQEIARCTSRCISDSSNCSPCSPRH